MGGACSAVRRWATDARGEKIDRRKISGAINVAVNDESLRARAAALGEKICAENGIARAVEIIERHAAEFKQRAEAKSKSE